MAKYVDCFFNDDRKVVLRDGYIPRYFTYQMWNRTPKYDSAFVYSDYSDVVELYAEYGIKPYPIKWVCHPSVAFNADGEITLTSNQKRIINEYVASKNWGDDAHRDLRHCIANILTNQKYKQNSEVDDVIMIARDEAVKKIVEDAIAEIGKNMDQDVFTTIGDMLKRKEPEYIQKNLFVQPDRELLFLPLLVEGATLVPRTKAHVTRGSEESKTKEFIKNKRKRLEESAKTSVKEESAEQDE